MVLLKKKQVEVKIAEFRFDVLPVASICSIYR